MCIMPRGGRDNSRNQQRPAWIVALTSKEDLFQIIILTACFLSHVISQRVIIICVAYYICFCAGWSSLSWCITKINWKERGEWYFVNKLPMWFGKKKLKVLRTQESNYGLLVSSPDALPLSYRRLRGTMSFSVDLFNNMLHLQGLKCR